MRRVIGLLLVLCLFTVGCSPTSDEKPVPPGPEREVELLWRADNPTELSPTGYGKLRPLELVKPTLVRSGKTETIGALSLMATLPAVPAEVPVYEAGNYPSTYQERFTHPLPWDFGPRDSLVWYDERRGGPLELGEGAPAEAVRELLQEKGLLMADSQTPTITTRTDGGTTIRFYRHLSDLLVYGNKPACVGLDHSGQLIYFVMRRRPLVSRSLYPLRTPEEAWQALQAGGWYEVGSSICQDGGIGLPAKIEEFRVTKVELAYWEPHSDREIQVMIPYYLFRNDEGHTLYVPAVKPEWIDQEWIDANQQ